MKEKIEALRQLANFLELQEIEKAKQELEKDLKIIKLERGNETLQEVIKDKDDAYKQIIETFKNALPKNPQQQGGKKNDNQQTSATIQS